jgi:hypothetical protein
MDQAKGQTYSRKAFLNGKLCYWKFERRDCTPQKISKIEAVDASFWALAPGDVSPTHLQLGLK